jgi:ubiquinone/menaquinone biosynthesis C-methylase UbiE
LKTQDKIFLPGTDKQLKIFLKTIDLKEKNALVIGSGCEEIAKIIAEASSSPVNMIVEDHNSLLNARLALSGPPIISVKLMDFESTDFKNESFDITYAQASISNLRRNKIIKEIKRILKPSGVFCVGENVNLRKEIPSFVKDIWESANISPLFIDDLNKYYQERNLKILFEEDLSDTLKDFYSLSAELLKEKTGSLTEQEKSYHKKLLKKISHESNAYIKLGGDKFMGFKMLIMEKAGA